MSFAPTIKKSRNYSGTAALAICLFINALYLKIVVPLIFFELNVGAYWGLAWRILHGQKLYQDVLAISGPVHPYIMAFFILLFGYTGKALFFHALATSSLAIVVTYLMLKKHLPDSVVIFLLAATTVTFHWFFGSPLHTTDAYLFALIGTWVLTDHIPITEKKAAGLCGFLCGFIGFITFMTKPNIGLFFTAAFFASLMFNKHRMISASSFAGGLFLSAFALSFMLPGYKNFFLDNFMPFAQKEHTRFLRLLRPWFWLELFYMPFFFAVLAASRPYLRKIPAWIFFFVMITGAVMGSRMLDTSPWLCLTATAVGFIVLYKIKELRSPGKKSSHKAFCIVLIIITLMQVGNIWYLMYAMRKRRAVYVRHEIQTPALKGWIGANRWAEAIDQLIPAINKFVPQNESLLVLDLDMPFLYGFVNHAGYQGIPFVFQLGIWPALDSPLANKVRSNIINNPPQWLVTYQERITLESNPAVYNFLKSRGFKLNTLAAYYRLDDWILINYEVVSTAGRYALMKHRGK